MTVNQPDRNGGFRIGEFDVHPDRRVIVGSGGETRIEPKVMAVLELLASTPREVVTRSELLNTVWAGTVVTEEVLTRCVSELRSVLRDSRESPTYIQTVPKSGYRLLVTPEPIASESAAPAILRRKLAGAVALLVAIAVAVLLAWSGGSSSPAIDEPAIAILPFEDLSVDGDEPYFAEGLAEELMYALARVRGLRVASRTSSFAYESGEDVRTIGRDLNVTTVLEGSVRRAGGRIRVNAQLTAVDTGFQLWVGSFDRELDDVFAIQNEIALAIARALELKLAQPGRFADAQPNVEAYDLYLLGRHHWHRRNPESLERAQQLFTAAIELDPNFALAYSGLADTYVFLASYGGLDREEAIAKAEAPVAKALELGPDLAESYASLGMLLSDKRDISGAQKAYERALELNPHYSMAEMWLGNTLQAQGRLREGHVHHMNAYRLDPLHPVVHQNLFWSLMSLGRYTEAEELLTKARSRELEPAATFTIMAGSVAFAQGKLARAQALAAQAIAKAPDGCDGYLLLSKAQRALGLIDAADASLRRAMEIDPTNFEAMHDIAERYAWQGDQAALEAFVAERKLELDAYAPWSDQMLPGLRGIAAARAGFPHDAASLLMRSINDAVTAPKHAKPLQVLTEVAHLLLALKTIEQPDRYETWVVRSRDLIEEYDRQGWADAPYEVAVALVLSLSGDGTEAAARMDDALALGWSPPADLDSDPLFAELDAALLIKLRLRLSETLERERAKLQGGLAGVMQAGNPG
jgi:TolB-like protein/DNA-binding winged helix-turn-helix (wHTH) protein/Tfp pilus assembly protein PilF